MHFFLDHDWMTEAGENLPVFRPPLDMHMLFGEPHIGEHGELGITVRYLTPHNKWSIHSEYQDNLLMLSLSRGGPDDLDEHAGRGQGRGPGQRLDRGGQPQRRRRRPGDRLPADAGGHGLHAPRAGPADRRPGRETSGKRGGIHNSLTRLFLKPTHLIGGYAQLSFAFNYLGPTGNQRDEVTVIRRRSQEVTY